jgi:hypothetical protein
MAFEHVHLGRPMATDESLLPEPVGMFTSRSVSREAPPRPFSGRPMAEMTDQLDSRRCWGSGLALLLSVPMEPLRGKARAAPAGHVDLHATAFAPMNSCFFSHGFEL